MRPPNFLALSHRSELMLAGSWLLSKNFYIFYFTSFSSFPCLLAQLKTLLTTFLNQTFRIRNSLWFLIFCLKSMATIHQGSFDRFFNFYFDLLSGASSSVFHKKPKVFWKSFSCLTLAHLNLTPSVQNCAIIVPAANKYFLWFQDFMRWLV